MIVRHKKTARLVDRAQMFRRRPGNCQPIECRRAAANLIENNEAAFRCLIENSGGFHHFDHEGRAAACKIVSGPDPREEAVYYPNVSRLWGHKAAHLRQDCDEGFRPEKGGFARHIRTSYQPKA